MDYYHLLKFSVNKQESRAQMNWKDGLRQTGVPAALGAALLFGAGTPLAKLLLATVSPWMLAGLLYLGSGLGLTLYRHIKGSPAAHLPRNEVPWFAGAVIAGGIVGPVLLMVGLTGLPASGASLMLNAEAVFTAGLAWFAFKENFDNRIAMGMVATIIGAVILSWPGGEIAMGGLWPSLAVLGACLAWGIDNNLTRKVSLTDASWIASVKGLVAGFVNMGLAFTLGAQFPPIPNIAGAMVVGFFAYGVSLALFVLALRHLGTARTGAYFSIAPFCGALLALIFGDPMTLQLLVAGGFMAIGIWLHVTESHGHEHVHEEVEHVHEHTHEDSHHNHSHEGILEAHDKDLHGVKGALSPSGVQHSHPHRHQPMEHSHNHFPDAHHQHSH